MAWEDSPGYHHTDLPTLEPSVPVVTVSPKYQVAIPREIREALGLEPGQKLQAFAFDGRVEFVPVKSAKALRGFVRGIGTSVPRDEKRV
jgi:AbrB family looped-hinge helix DNA binding protein